MNKNSGIEWTDATWNPVTGCTRVSAGCDNCYAAVLASRLLKDIYLAKTPIVDSDTTRRDPFAVRIWPERVGDPLRWREPRQIFVNSMSDLFHKDIPVEFVRQVFDVMLRANWHVYQILTKRPARAKHFLESQMDLFPDGVVPEHIWMGTSVENQKASFRIGHLREIRAQTRFLSCEPLIGPISMDLSGIHWVIVGGESGAGRREIRASWVRGIRDQCRIEGVPFFFKQWGGRTPKAGGRELDGLLWDEMPLAQATGS